MRAYAHGEGCLMQFLQQALDDPDAAALRPLLGLHRRAAGARARDRLPRTVDAARRFFRGQDVVVEPRKLWAGGLPDRKGKITFLVPGRALAFADDPAWNAELAELWRADAPAPPVILDGHGRGADAAGRGPGSGRSRWWPCRPGASRRWSAPWPSTSPTVGRLPLVDALAVSGPPPSVGRRLGRPGQGSALPHRRSYRA